MKVGFIGLGQMGKWMALNILKAGHEVTVYNRSAQKMESLVAEGAARGESPADLARFARVVFTSLPDTDAVQQVLLGPDGVMGAARPGLAVVDLSTISYMGTLEVHRRLAEQGVQFADAPVSGLEARAKDGTLTVMYGGDEALYAELLPIFQCIGNTILHMGPVGAGQLTKLINQLLFDANMSAVAEILPLATKFGLDPEKVVQIATTGTGRSFGLEFFAPLILENRFHTAYPIQGAYKDLVSAAEISAHEKIPLPIVNATAMVFQMALAQGLGDHDKGGLIKVYEQLLGVKFRKRGFEE